MSGPPACGGASDGLAYGPRRLHAGPPRMLRGQWHRQLDPLRAARGRAKARGKLNIRGRGPRQPGPAPAGRPALPFSGRSRGCSLCRPARGGGPPFNGAEPGGAAHGAIAAAASQRPAPDPQEKADSAPAGFPLHKSRPTSPPGVPLARAHTVLVAKRTCTSSALATSAISAETSAFDSGTASTTKPARASRLGACATPKTSATNGALYCLRCKPEHIRTWCSMRSEGEHALVPGSCLQPQMR